MLPSTSCWSLGSTTASIHLRPGVAGPLGVLERPGGELSVLHQGATIASREAPPRAGVLRAARSELPRNPDHERIASGLGSGGAPRRLPVAPAVPAAEGAPNGAAVKPEPGSKQLRPPTPRQLACWKAIQQAQLQGLSMWATAGCSGSPATPSAATSGPTACLDARPAPRHPPTETTGLTKSLLSCTDKIAARRQLEQLWKAIRQAQLQGLSMRATARVLGISRNTVRSYLRAGGPPGRQGAASSTEQRPAREDIFAELLSGQSR